MQTPLQITFRNIERSEALEGRIRERVGRLERLHPDIIGCRVVVETPYRSPGAGKVPVGLSVEVEVPGRTMVSKSSEEPRETKDGTGRVVTTVFDAIERQLEDARRIRRKDVKEHEAEMEAGRIVRLFPEERYGFVEVSGGTNLFFSETVLQGLAFEALDSGTMVAVTRASGEGPMGPQASSVRRMGESIRMPSG
ncbi:HPF/RaiA family ribosome-associated protein [Geminicoccaceae bacterium 1502E]|nr:HPF/RaiA family ribosome-associated protein [Geminicoccaceae bacterium 1502E]